MFTLPYSTFLRIIIGIYLLSHSFLPAHGQINANWYYAEGLGLQFTNSGLEVDTFCANETFENCVSLSDHQGNLLFYSNGDEVWDTTHNIMPHGDSLLGSKSAAQGLISFPVPGDSGRYYIFMTSAGEYFTSGFFPFSYSIIDMSLNGGLGDVDTNFKNVILFDSAKTEMVTACYGTGTNAHSIWVTTFKDSNRMVTYRVDSTGVYLHSNALYTYRQMNAFSSYSAKSGYYIYHALRYDGFFRRGICISKFDAESGTPIDPVFLTADMPNVSGFFTNFEISENEQYLYLAHYKSVFGEFQQSIISVPLVDHDSLSMVTGMDTIFAYDSAGAFIDMELGPDGIIYLRRSWTYDSLSTIQNPNQEGGGAIFTLNAASSSNPGTTFHQRFPEYLLGPINEVRAKHFCLGDSTFFNVGPYATSASWSFDDPSSGSLNTANGDSVKHLFSDTGTFEVQCYVFGLDTDTLSIVVRITPPLHDILPDSVTLCQAQFFTPDSNGNGFLFIWNDSIDSISIYADSSGWYKLLTGNECDTLLDSIYITVDSFLTVSLPEDQTLCVPDSLVIIPSISAQATIVWNDGSSEDTFSIITNPSLIDSTLFITLSATTSCAFVTDTMLVFVLARPEIDLPADTVSCSGQAITLHPRNGSSGSYIWNGDTSSSLTVDTTQNILVQLESACGFDSALISISIHPTIDVELGEDTTICNGDSVQLDATWSSSVYEWTNNRDSVLSTDSTLLVNDTGTYIVAISKGPCTHIESRIFSYDASCLPFLCDLEVPNVFSPNGDGLNDIFAIQGFCDDRDYSISIYNRWGQLVEQKNLSAYIPSIKVSWDGYVNGSPSAEGTYFLSITSTTGVEYSGSFTLVK